MNFIMTDICPKRNKLNEVSNVSFSKANSSIRPVYSFPDHWRCTTSSLVLNVTITHDLHQSSALQKELSSVPIEIDVTFLVNLDGNEYYHDEDDGYR